jgi:L-alanine-DL-glutamate epimerase-like enolase superfamily enzyme
VRIGFVQIDCGRIGGIGPAKRVADYAAQRGITYVNHTFTSHLALSASLQPYAGLAADTICEYPFSPKSLAWDLSVNHLIPDSAGEVSVPEVPGLGIEVDTAALQKYLIPVEIIIKGSSIYTSPSLN